MKIKRIVAALASAAIIAASSTGISPFRETFSITVEAASKLPSPEGVRTSASENSVTLKWKKVSGADAYRVYKYDPAKKNYTVYKDVTSCKCTVKKLDPETPYKFKIAALTKKSGKYAVQTKSPVIKVTTKKSAAFKVTSKDLSSGVWDTVITHTSNGSDRSPELSWNAVEGAEEYAVYMLDVSANNWMHWRVSGIKTTHLDAGSASEPELGMALKNEYIGPYPPSGTHTYVITVFALKKPADSYPGKFNAKNESIDNIKNFLDISGGKSGNVLATASLSGTYTHGDR